MRTWTADQLGAVLGATDDHRMCVLFAVLALTGARRGEALGLRWSDLNMETGRVSVVQTVGKVAGKTVVGTTKTYAGKRVVALDTGLVALLRQHPQVPERAAAADGSGWRDSDLVFPRVTGDVQYPETVSRVFRETVDRLGLPPIRLHDLRHIWATLALQAKVPPKVVQERLGHANIAITFGDLQSRRADPARRGRGDRRSAIDA